MTGVLINKLFITDYNYESFNLLESFSEIIWSRIWIVSTATVQIYIW